jgi:hypothetical protein
MHATRNIKLITYIYSQFYDLLVIQSSNKMLAK